MQRLNYRLFEIYNIETGKEAIYDSDGRTCHTLDYVNWLEKRIPFGDFIDLLDCSLFSIDDECECKMKFQDYCDVKAPCKIGRT